MELVARAGKTSEPHSLEAVADLEAREAHLGALALVTRLEKGLCLHEPSCHIAGKPRSEKCPNSAPAK
jgi:hypothetical protein